MRGHFASCASQSLFVGVWHTCMLSVLFSSWPVWVCLKMQARGAFGGCFETLETARHLF